LLGIGQCALGFVAVVQAQQPHAAAVHAATGIDLGKIGARTWKSRPISAAGPVKGADWPSTIS
jgi:hypothetical protein